MNLIKEIENIREGIFLYDIGNLIENILRIVENIEVKYNKMNAERRNSFNEILKWLNIYMENKDYLTVSDILKYELTAFLCEISKETE